MEQYSVKAVTRLTGLTPETLRAWERRYGAVSPERDGAGRRVYTASDVERLRRFKQLVDSGHPIGRVVAMDERDRDRLIEQAAARPAAAEFGALRDRLMAAVREYDTAALEQQIGRAMATADADLLVDEVFGPVLDEVGKAWQRGEIDIAQERLVSSFLQSRILALLRSAPDLRPALLLATPGGERHELGLLLFAYRAASRLIPLRYLGADLPVTEIRRLARHFQPRIIGLSVVNPPADTFPRELEPLADDGLEVWLGGAGAMDLDESLPPGCRVLRSAGEVRSALDGLAGAR